MSADYKLKDTGPKNGITVSIFEDMCKGCTICVDFCPTDVLLMVDVGSRWQGSVVMIDDIEACIGCMLCEIQCPDFAIDVHKPAKKKKAAKAAVKE